MSKAIPLTILLACVFILQVHGIAFWVDKVGHFGWAWSLLLETAALWLWYQPKIAYRGLAIAVSLMTLAGPIHQVTEPVFTAGQEINSQLISAEIRLNNLIAEKERLEDLLKTYQANSVQRTGWLSPITNTNTRILEIDREIGEITLSTPHDKNWSLNWVLIMEVSGLIVFQIVAVLTILALRTNNTQKVNNTSKKEARQIKAAAIEDKELLVTKANDDINPIELLNKLEGYLQNTGKTARWFSEYSGVSAKDISFLRNHEKRVLQGERTISVNALEQIQTMLNKVIKE